MMNNKNIKKYIQYLNKEIKLNVADNLLEKDYFLSLFLSNMQKLKDNGKIKEMNNLVFKGGTLLTKNFLNYHRISEDLDFTHISCNEIGQCPGSRRERKINNIVKEVIDEVKLVSDLSKFDFEIDRTNSRFILMRNSRSVYILKIYYKSVFGYDSSFIKLEINFIDELQKKPGELKINNIIDFYEVDKKYLQSIGYDLINAKVLSYPIEEIILEKFRALLTRPEFKERDLFDLFLINKDNLNVFGADIENIVKKIKRGMSIVPQAKDNLKENLKKLKEDNFFVSSDDVDSLTLVKYDKKAYEQFRERIKEFSISILEKFNL